jgi:hypothetical protein
MGGHRPKLIAGKHRIWLLPRIMEGNFTLRGLVAELAERGLKVDFRTGRTFVQAEMLHKKRGDWRAIVPTAPDGAHSRQSTKTRPRPSGWSSSMRLGPRPTWRRCGMGAAGQTDQSQSPVRSLGYNDILGGTALRSDRGAAAP